MIVNISRKVRYRNFGFIPTGKWSSDLYGKLIGHRNLIKRLQALDILKALNIDNNDIVLDFGCGAGYITVEIAKVSKLAYGIDINPYLNQIQVPECLKDKLKYIVITGEQLSFKDSYFDKVLASEIMPMVPDPAVFLSEIYRVLKKDGVLVVSNGAGHPAIRDGYDKKSIIFRLFTKLYRTKMPASYDAYCEILQRSFGTGRNNFIEEDEMCRLLVDSGFRIESVSYTPGYLAGSYFSWTQFRYFLTTGKTLTQKYFAAKFIFWSIVRIFEWKNYKGGLLCVARKV